MNNTGHSLVNRIILYFFRGLLLIAPLGATIYLISIVLQKIDGVISLSIPGLGMFIVFVSITLLGYVGTTLWVKNAFGFTESFIKKVPLIRGLYTLLKDFTSAFVSSKKKFNKPVMVLLDKETQTHRIGFMTNDALEEFSMPNHVAVYLPNSFELAGILVIVPLERVKPLNLPSAEVMRFNFSGALTSLRNSNAKEENDIFSFE